MQPTVPGQTQHGADHGACEELEGDQGADWVSRQTDDGDAVQLPYRERLPRLHRDPPEVERTGRLEHVPHVVMLAHTDASGGDDQVERGAGTQRLLDVFPAVPDPSDAVRLTTSLGDCRLERRPVAVVDLAGL